MKLVFVSSTFKDMQFERDLLQTYAIPTLNNRLREYGEKAYFGDLRWGVNTTDLDSDEGSRKVLKVCLDQIDNCKPYMIVLIGERYGWIPAQELIDEACVLKGIEKIKDISVTELEIDYGALLNPEYEGRILFYFRRLDKSGMTEAELRDYCAESEIHFKKVEELKRRIEEIYPDHIRYYDAVWNAEEKRVTGLENFLSLVQSDLGDVLLRDLEEENRLPWQERSMQAAHRYFEECNKTLVPTDNAAVVYAGSGFGEDGQIIYISGAEGSGKSARVISGYCAHEGERLAFSFGLDKFSRDSLAFDRVLIYKLESILGYEHAEYEDAELCDRALELLSELKEPIGIYVDNASEDFLQELSMWEMKWRSDEKQLKINAALLIAVQTDLPFYPFFEISGKAVMGKLSQEDSERVLDCIVKSNHKEISDVVKERILSKESSGSAAYLKSIVKRLMILDSEDFAAIRAMGDGMDNINKYMISIVDSVSDDRYEILCELAEEAMDRINRVFVERLIGVFTHIPFGLNIDEIRDVFDAYGWEFNDLDFSLSVQMLEEVLSYDPYFRRYKIKNNAIEKCVCRYSCKWDAVPAAEYMLESETLCPYAFRAAVLDAEPEYLISVLKRSGISDISKSICCLIERGLSERAISVLTAVASNEDFWEVSMLPPADSLHSDNRDLYYGFFKHFADGCVGNITKAERSSLLLSTNIDARLMVAECALELSPESSIEIILEAYKLSRAYAETAETGLINRLYFLLLKAVNRTKSVKLFEHFFHGEEFLDSFDFESEYDKSIFKMKVYTEFSEIAALVDEDLGKKYHDMAYELALEADVFLCKAGDFEYIAKLIEDVYWLLLGKTLFASDLGLFRAEVRLDLYNFDSNCADTMHKAEEIWNRTGLKSDCIVYWRSILYYFAHLSDNGEPFDDDLIKTYISLTKHLVERNIDINQYVEILHFAGMLEYVDDIEDLLEAAKCDGELESVVQKMIKYYYVDEDMDAFLDLMEEFDQRKEGYMGIERIAAISIEGYFDLLTEEDEE